ncbi:MAG TPA: hypothetical protein VFM23_01410 [Gemmatimonadales bacterium]|nr:hypothetical protein [Gemmatimonadales bacterium]
MAVLDSAVDQWSWSDTTLAERRDGSGQSLNAIALNALAAGTVTITASRQGVTGHATLVIRKPEPGEAWEAIDLGSLVGGASGMATAIGDNGIVVGTIDSADAPNASWSFMYKDGAIHKLPATGRFETPARISPTGRILGIVNDTTDRLVIWDTPDAAPRRFGGHDGIATIVGINERGEVLLTTRSDSSPYSSRAVLWRQNIRVDLGDLSDSTVANPSTSASAWNNRGQIVGASYVRTVTHTDGLAPTFVQHPFLWENGIMRDLGVLASRPCTQVATPGDCGSAVAADINASGVIVGYADGADGKKRAVIWENGVIRDLGVDPGHNTWASAINDRGQVLVFSEGYGQVFLWENGQLQSTTLMSGRVLGPNGEVVGTWCPSMGADPGDCTLYIWQAGRMTALGPGAPIALNAHGEIVGWRECCSHKRPMLWRLSTAP